MIDFICLCPVGNLQASKILDKCILFINICEEIPIGGNWENCSLLFREWTMWGREAGIFKRIKIISRQESGMKNIMTHLLILILPSASAVASADKSADTSAEILQYIYFQTF